MPLDLGTNEQAMASLRGYINFMLEFRQQHAANRTSVESILLRHGREWLGRMYQENEQRKRDGRDRLF